MATVYKLAKDGSIIDSYSVSNAYLGLHYIGAGYFVGGYTSGSGPGARKKVDLLLLVNGSLNTVKNLRDDSGSTPTTNGLSFNGMNYLHSRESSTIPTIYTVELVSRDWKILRTTDVSSIVSAASISKGIAFNGLNILFLDNGTVYVLNASTYTANDAITLTSPGGFCRDITVDENGFWVSWYNNLSLPTKTIITHHDYTGKILDTMTFNNVNGNGLTHDGKYLYLSIA